MGHFLNAVDAFLCVIVVFVSLDYVRRFHPSEAPLLCASCYLAAIGAFGGIIDDLTGQFVTVNSVIMHAGMALYIWANHAQLGDDPRVRG